MCECHWNFLNMMFGIFMSFLTDVRFRNFRSQTSDIMDIWKSRGGKSQRREEKRREKRED